MRTYPIHIQDFVPDEWAVRHQPRPRPGPRSPGASRRIAAERADPDIGDGDRVVQLAALLFAWSLVLACGIIAIVLLSPGWPTAVSVVVAGVTVVLATAGSLALARVVLWLAGAVAPVHARRRDGADPAELAAATRLN